MTTRLRYPKGYQFFDSNGNPLALGNLYYYVAGGSTLQNTYSDSAGTVPNSNPIVLDGSGRLPVDVYLGSVADYKEVLTTSAATISPWPDDNIQRATTINVFTGDSGSGGASGLVPAPAAGDALANKFLKADGTWSVTPSGSGSGSTNLSVSETANTVSIGSSTGSGATIPAATSSLAGVLDSGRAAKIDGLATVAASGSYNDLTNKPAAPSNMTGATVSTAGTAGLVPAPAAGQQSSYLQGSGAFALPFADNYTVSAELNPNPTFATSLSGWTVTGDFTWNTGGGAISASSGTLFLKTGQPFVANTIYHARVVVASNAGSTLTFSLVADPAGTTVDFTMIYGGSGTYDCYFLSPGPIAGNEEFTILNSGAQAVISSVSFTRMTFTQKALVGGLDLSQGGQLILPDGRQNAPSLYWTDPNNDATGFCWDTHSQQLKLVSNGIVQMAFNTDPTGTSTEIDFPGSNRGTIQASAALVLRAFANHFELEGGSTASPSVPLEIVGYRGGTALGCPVKFRGEASSGNEPNWVLGVQSGSVSRDNTLVFQIMDHTATTNGGWYANGNIQAPNVVYNNASVNLAAGYTTTIYSNGTVTSGTLTPNISNGNIQSYTNNGAHTLAPPSIAAGQATHFHLVVTNGASAGAINTSAFTDANVSGYATTSGKLFDFYIYAENAFSSLNVVAR